jgi:hypothetical protein
MASLTAIPVEHRLAIYEDLLPDVDTILPIHSPATRFRNDRKSCTPALLRTCRHVYQEAASTSIRSESPSSRLATQYTCPLALLLEEKRLITTASSRLSKELAYYMSAVWVDN